MPTKSRLASVSLATAQWWRRILELEFEDSLLSGYVEETFTRQEAELADEWCGQLEYNLTNGFGLEASSVKV